MHRTADGVEIRAGLRVMTNDCKLGTVEEHDYDGWYHIRMDGGGRGYANGERMTATHRYGNPSKPLEG
jgi:hypothetical protein